MTSSKDDMAVVVADKNMQATFAGLLTRYHSLGIRPIVLSQGSPTVHSGHDPGCWKTGPELLAAEFNKPNKAKHGLLALDCQGSNSGMMAGEMQQELQSRIDKLTQPGWGSVVVFEPELEIWVFSLSPQVDLALDWKPGLLRSWLTQTGYLAPGEIKPADPKAAVEAALKEARKPRSSSIYRQLAKKVGLKDCEDPSFQAFKTKLREWFPPEITC